MYQVYTSVKVIDEKSEHFEKVGTNLSADEPLTVKFDDGTEAKFKLKQLQGL